MKPVPYFKAVIMVICLTILALPVQAAEVEGIRFSETHVVDGNTLYLAGTGLLRY